RAGVELLSQHDADGLGCAWSERHTHFPRSRNEPATRGHAKDISPRGQKEIGVAFGIELGEKRLASQELNELPLTPLDGDSRVQRRTVGVCDTHLQMTATVQVVEVTGKT